MKQFKSLRLLLPEDGSKFPIVGNLEPICGKTLVKSGNWWKAIVLTKQKVKNREKYQLRLYGWFKNEEGVYKVRQKFNVSLSSYLSNIIDILQVFVQESKNEVILEKLYKKAISRIKELEKALKESELSKHRVEELEESLKEFKKLISNKRTNERDVSNFLKKNTWMFGSQYKEISKKEKGLTIKSRYDFLLKKFDGYYDILELKHPNSKLFIKKGNKKVMSKDLRDSISQVIIYLAEARTHYLSIKKETGRDIYFPKGLIVIGRRNEDEKELLKIHTEFLHNIDILTYDDVIDTAQKTIKMLKGEKLNYGGF